MMFELWLNRTVGRGPFSFSREQRKGLERAHNEALLRLREAERGLALLEYVSDNKNRLAWDVKRNSIAKALELLGHPEAIEVADISSMRPLFDLAMARIDSLKGKVDILVGEIEMLWSHDLTLAAHGGSGVSGDYDAAQLLDIQGEVTRDAVYKAYEAFELKYGPHSCVIDDIYKRQLTPAEQDEFCFHVFAAGKKARDQLLREIDLAEGACRTEQRAAERVRRCQQLEQEVRQLEVDEAAGRELATREDEAFWQNLRLAKKETRDRVLLTPEQGYQWWLNNRYNAYRQKYGSIQNWWTDLQKKRWESLAILGLSPYSSASDCRTAYREMARRNHPDKFLNLGNQRVQKLIFQAIQEAYETLTRSR